MQHTHFGVGHSPGDYERLGQQVKTGLAFSMTASAIRLSQSPNVRKSASAPQCLSIASIGDIGQFVQHLRDDVEVPFGKALREPAAGILLD